MKLKTSSLCWMLAVTGAFIPLARPAAAQSAITPGASGRLSVVELRDTSLADALEMIFKSAGNPSHIIDDSATLVQIPSITLNNIAWDAAVRNLANLNNFKVSRNESGAWLVEPRAPVIPEGGSLGEDGLPFAPLGSNGSGMVPSNPFGSRGSNPFNTARPSIRTFGNAQTLPNTGGRGGRAGGTAASSTEGKDYKIIIVRHIYAGGLAQLFANSTVIDTESFVSPASSSNGSNGNGNNRNGGRSSRGGSSSFGGGTGGGGFGGGVSSFGGGSSGGFGGGTSSFGGGSSGGFGGGFGF